MPLWILIGAGGLGDFIFNGFKCIQIFPDIHCIGGSIPRLPFNGLLVDFIWKIRAKSTPVQA